MTSQPQKCRFCFFCLGSVCLNKIFKKTFYVCKANTSTGKMHFKMLQFLVVMYDMGFLRCAIDVVQTVVVYFLCLSNFLNLKCLRVHQSLLENAFSRIRTYVLLRLK